MHASAVTALSAFWSRWQRAEVKAAERAKARSVIMIFNCGAPSHLDLWDMKPDAPDNVRGEFRPIATNVPGIFISELMPRLAKLADKYAIVRSVHHGHSAHNAGMYWSIVGRPYRVDSTLINPSRNDFPSLGTLVGWLARRDGYQGALPPYVITPAPHCDSTAYITPGQFGGCLGAQHDPFVVNSDPNAADFRVPNLTLVQGLSEERLATRRKLLGQMDRKVAMMDPQAVLDLEINNEKAFRLVTARDMARAFDLSEEPDQVRERFGRHTWGQSHLLARRLVEAGVRFVATVNGQSIVWDTHEDNFRRLKSRLVPPMEQAFAALLEDLDQRGLLETTLVLWIGDFGRTPVINAKAGRDHWPQCYSVVLAGGGIRGGQVIGESDRTGAVPKSYPVTPADIHATIFTALGYDPHAITYTSPTGAPARLSDGQVIRELL
ncbi:MAG: hypothetical protein KatS3mg110_3572 [Pirellulaceae bacterium]|nr:MAG: hypothetical protein KatS3mg110_3572 [Pirellulaceae bacterium]